MSKKGSPEFFKKQLKGIVPIPIKTAEDLLKLPPELKKAIQIQLEIEMIAEALKNRKQK